ncbi:hypothetical protein E2C01_100232 [Portunus trituberculatus]|uniref:Uncharacterized protein n=1 Tax=Portunus trituberculatus TaxID=210409 RepID=A0A5B7KHF3_PORTR|nr:hypothetical protein [Portunus trituberculatus]
MSQEMTADGYAPAATHSSRVLRPSTSGSAGALITTDVGRAAGRIEQSLFSINSNKTVILFSATKELEYYNQESTRKTEIKK